MNAVSVAGDVYDQIRADLYDQLATYVQKRRRFPNFLYVNTRFWEDAPVKIHEMTHLLKVNVRTSELMPYTGAFLTEDEFPADDLAKHLGSGGKVGLI